MGSDLETKDSVIVFQLLEKVAMQPDSEGTGVSGKPGRAYEGDWISS